MMDLLSLTSSVVDKSPKRLAASQLMITTMELGALNYLTATTILLTHSTRLRLMPTAVLTQPTTITQEVLVTLWDSINTTGCPKSSTVTTPSSKTPLSSLLTPSPSGWLDSRPG